MSQLISFGRQAHEALLDGVNIIDKAVGSTLGPYGKTVLIDGNPHPKLTKDGVSVARVIMLKDPIANLGATIIRTASEETYREAGDGTTTSTVMAAEAARVAFGLIQDNPSISRAKLRMEMNDIVKSVVAKIAESAVSIVKDGIPDYDAVRSVARIASNGDEKVADLVVEAFKICGERGVVNINESGTNESHTKEQSGAIFDAKIADQRFINSAKSRFTAKAPIIILYDGDFIQGSQLVSVFEPYRAEVEAGRPIIFIANGFSNAFISVLNHNNAKGLSLSAFYAPAYGDLRRELMTDLAAATGGVYMSERTGHTIEAFKKEWGGSCAEVEANFDYMSFFGLHQDPIDYRINTLTGLREAMEQDNRFAEAAAVNARISNLSSNVATILVGGQSAEEVSELKDRVDDAVCAVRSAIEEGVVEGGGLTAFRIGYNMSEGTFAHCIIAETLQAPYRRILNNAEAEYFEGKGSFFAPDGTCLYFPIGEDPEPLDLKNTSVIDPAKVLRCALENAISAAGNLITTDTVISIE